MQNLSFLGSRFWLNVFFCNPLSPQACDSFSENSEYILDSCQ